MDSRLIGVVTGLAFVYLFLTTAVTQVNELIAGLLATRARYLEKGIKEKLLDPKLGQKLLDTPLIRSLGFTRPNLPSYIPSQTFAHALRLVLAGNADTSEVPFTLAKWTEAINNADIGAELKQRLISVATQGVNTAEAVETSIAKWFDNAMDRLSGAYKRRAQLVACLLAMVVVTTSNADTFALADKLWRDPVQRQAEIVRAQKMMETCRRDPDNHLICEEESSDRLPIGWTQAEWKHVSLSVAAALAKVFGLFASALAVSLGAPVWFEILKRLAPGWSMSGPRPQRSGETHD